MAGLTLEQWGTHGPVYGPAGAATGLPAVVVVHGAEGPMAGWSHRFAAILAAHGLLALPWSYGEGDFFAAGPIAGVDLRGLLAAGAGLAAHPRAGRVGLLGWSKGAEAALLLASLTGPAARAAGGAASPFACAAAHAAPDRITAALDPAALRSGAPALDDAPDAARAWIWPGREDALAPGTPLAVEDAGVPLFLSAGSADPVWPAAMVRNLAGRLQAAGRPADLFWAEGQGHGFDFDTEPAFWRRLLAFFERHLGPAA